MTVPAPGSPCPARLPTQWCGRHPCPTSPCLPTRPVTRMSETDPIELEQAAGLHAGSPTNVWLSWGQERGWWPNPSPLTASSPSPADPPTPSPIQRSGRLLRTRGQSKLGPTLRLPCPGNRAEGALDRHQQRGSWGAGPRAVGSQREGPHSPLEAGRLCRGPQVGFAEAMKQFCTKQPGWGRSVQPGQAGA